MPQYYDDEFKKKKEYDSMKELLRLKRENEELLINMGIFLASAGCCAV